MKASIYLRTDFVGVVWSSLKTSMAHDKSFNGPYRPPAHKYSAFNDGRSVMTDQVIPTDLYYSLTSAEQTKQPSSRRRLGATSKRLSCQQTRHTFPEYFRLIACYQPQRLLVQISKRTVLKNTICLLLQVTAASRSPWPRSGGTTPRSRSRTC